MANEQAWADLAMERENPQPTPRIGKNVTWYINGDLKHPVAGLVTGIEGPGRLKLVVFPVGGMIQHKAGVYHTSARIHQKPNNPTTRNCGCWDYVEGRPPKADFELQELEFGKREAALKAGDEAIAKASEDYDRKQAERANGPKKRLPDPLPANMF